MLRAEAAWLARELRALPLEDLSPLLSVGSGHAELAADQPWVRQVVYEPLEQRGIRVLHHDLEPAAHVDVAGDLMDASFRQSLESLGVRSVMCCNVLEHVPDAASLASTLERIVAPGGYAVVTAPRRYPYHPGPIDTMFRPTVEGLRAMLPGLTEVTAATEIRCESLLSYLIASPNRRGAITRGFRSFAQQNGGASVPLRETARMLFLSTAVSAVILRRR